METITGDFRDRLQRALGSSYVLGRELGGGGMSRVFVAEETALGRAVVVKVIAPELAEGLSAERFAREIRLAAGLQQANIVPVLQAGVIVNKEAHEGLPYYTMPYVDGESLRARLAGGPLSIAAAVSVLRDVARALQYAHARGIVHRDIKPDNVLLSGGTAVVTDFGIAKAVRAARTRGDGTATLTGVGIALGTPAYMAPEQAAGDPDADQRADIYALGCLAHELLVGTPPFHGRTPQQVLAAHVMEPPVAVRERRPDVPAPLAAIVERALAKSPDDRPTITDILVALDGVASGATPAVRTRRTTWRALAAVAVVLVAGAMAFYVVGPRSPAPLALGATTQVTTSPELEIDAAISPDGRMVAYTAQREHGTRVLVRQVDGGRTIEVAPDVTTAQRWPRWSPDGTQLLFSSAGTVYVVPALGGAPRALVQTSTEFLHSNPTPAWSPDGRRFAYADSAGIRVTSVDGGRSQLVARGGDLHAPSWSPDGRTLAYVAGNRNYASIPGNTSPSAIWSVPVGGGAPRRLTETLHLNTSPVWLPDGRGLLYVSNVGGTRDVYQLALRRDGTPAGEPVRLTTGLEPYTISLDAAGRRLAYVVLRLRANIWTAPVRPNAATPESAIVAVTTENQRVEGVSISHDGRTLVYDANRHGNADIFRIPATAGEPVQLTRDPADDFQPVWSPDDRFIAFYSTRSGSRDIYVMDAEGQRTERVTSLPGQERFPSWSPDGQRLVFASNAAGAGGRAVEDLYVVRRLAGGGWSAPTRLTHDGAGWPRWSPDGRWISAIRSGQLLLVAADGSGERVRIAPRPSEASVLFTDWGKDPSIVYFAELTLRSLTWDYRAAPVLSGEPRSVLRVPIAKKGTSGGVTFSTDGRQIYFTLGQDEGDVWTVDLQRR